MCIFMVKKNTQFGYSAKHWAGLYSLGLNFPKQCPF